MTNKAIVDISAFVSGAIPPLSRLTIDSSNACNQVSAPIVFRPLHGTVQFTIY